MAVWTETTETYSGLEGNFTPTCLFHPEVPTVMELFDIKHLNFKLHPDKEDEPWSFATDVVLRCPYCGFDDVYGVAMSPDHHKKMVKKNEWLIVQNTVHAHWKRHPIHVGVMLIRWLIRKLTLKHPS